MRLVECRPPCQHRTTGGTTRGGTAAGQRCPQTERWNADSPCPRAQPSPGPSNRAGQPLEAAPCVACARPWSARRRAHGLLPWTARDHPRHTPPVRRLHDRKHEAECRAIKQRMQSSRVPPCHRHMGIATPLSVHCIALPHRSANQTSAECCPGFTTRGGYRMFPRLSRSALTLPLAPVSHEPCTLGLVSTLPHSLWLTGTFLTLFPTALGAGGGGGGAVRARRIQLRKIAKNSEKIAGKLRKNCGAITKPPEASRSNPFAQDTHMAPTSTPGGQGANAKKLRNIAKNCGPQPPPPPR